MQKLYLICTAKASLYFKILTGMRFPESYWLQWNSGENESNFLIFVYTSGTKYGK